MPFLNVFVAGSNLLCSIIGIGLAIPLVKRRIKMNRWYGMRFTRSFESDESWYAINEYGGRRLIVWSIIVAIIGLAALVVSLEERQILVGLFVLAPLLYVVPVIESYLYAKRL